MLAPTKNRGVTYQTDEKHLTNLREYFVGMVKLACYDTLVYYYLSLIIISQNIIKKGHRKNSQNVTF